MLSKGLKTRIPKIENHLNCQNDGYVNSNSTLSALVTPHCKKVDGNAIHKEIIEKTAYVSKENLFETEIGK